MVTITDSAIRHTIYETIYDLINTDKSTYGASSTPTLYGGFPDLSTITFPSIIIPNIKVDTQDFTIDTERISHNNNITITIFVFSKGNQDLDIIIDGISNTLHTNTFDGAYLVSSTEDDSFISPNDNKIKSKTLTITYKRRT